MSEINKLIHLAEKSGIKVEFKGKDVLKDYAGMNWKAAKELGFKMPENTIYLLEGDNPTNQLHTLRHELIEVRHMEHGEHYFLAHEYALRWEKCHVKKLPHAERKKHRKAVMIRG